MRAEVLAGAHPRFGLSLRQLLPGWIALCLVAVLAWTVTITWAGSMGVGAGTMGLPFGAFLVVWTIMMAAMMFPSVAPMAIVWIRSVAVRPNRRGRIIGISSFLTGYLFAWTAFGAAVYAAYCLARAGSPMIRPTPHDGPGPRSSPSLVSTN